MCYELIQVAILNRVTALCAKKNITNKLIIMEKISELKTTCLQIITGILDKSKGVCNYSIEDIIKEYQKLKEELCITSCS